ncbi:histone H2A-like 3 [Pan troglodytes]|uniref:histone H2A-like 3 n=2 Tax=Pan TaxID=9596 RepID=UPI0023F58AE2|nr:histone H2A-like 3 [Pan troglodytes]
MTSKSGGCHKGNSLTNEGLEHRDTVGGNKHWYLERLRPAGKSSCANWGKTQQFLMAGNKMFCRPRRQRLSHSRRAELQFPVSHLERCLRESQHAWHLSSTTPVFLAGVLEYLTANILEKVGKEVKNSCRLCITPEHVKRALQKDEQLRWILELEDDTHSQVEEMPQSEEEEEEEEKEEEMVVLVVMGGRRRRRRRRRRKDS